VRTGAGFGVDAPTESAKFLAQRDGVYARLLQLDRPIEPARTNSAGQIMISTPEEQQWAASLDYEVTYGSDHDMVVTAVNDLLNTAVDGGE